LLARKKSRQGVEVELDRESPDGEPQRTDRGCGVFQANGKAERDAALIMLKKLRGTQSVSVGGDKGFDTFGFCGGMPESVGDAARGAEPDATRGSAIDGRTTVDIQDGQGFDPTKMRSESTSEPFRRLDRYKLSPASRIHRCRHLSAFD
jgi:hypothetical protein